MKTGVIGIALGACVLALSACSFKIQVTNSVRGFNGMTELIPGQIARIGVPVEKSAVTEIRLKVPASTIRFPKNQNRQSNFISVNLWFPHVRNSKTSAWEKQKVSMEELKSSLRPGLVLDLDQKLAEFDSGKLPWSACPEGYTSIVSREMSVLINEVSFVDRNEGFAEHSTTVKSNCISDFIIRSSAFGGVRIYNNGVQISGFKNFDHLKSQVSNLQQSGMRDVVLKMAAEDLFEASFLDEDSALFFIRNMDHSWDQDFLQKLCSKVGSQQGIRYLMKSLSSRTWTDFVLKNPALVMRNLESSDIPVVLKTGYSHNSLDVLKAIGPYIKIPFSSNDALSTLKDMSSHQRYDALSILAPKLEKVDQSFGLIEEISSHERLDALELLVKHLRKISTPNAFLRTLQILPSHERLEGLEFLMSIADDSLVFVKPKALSLISSHERDDALELMKRWP